jgi:hypothetical protein
MEMKDYAEDRMVVGSLIFGVGIGNVVQSSYSGRLALA